MPDVEQIFWQILLVFLLADPANFAFYCLRAGQSLTIKQQR